jgi:small-conductance mechanosensitive channel
MESMQGKALELDQDISTMIFELTCRCTPCIPASQCPYCIAICSGLVSWLVVLAGVLSSMHVVGVNIQPLLTVGGVSGVIVGLSAQSVMANMISGINLVGLSSRVRYTGCQTGAAVATCTYSSFLQAISSSTLHTLQFQHQYPMSQAELRCMQFLSQPFVVGDRVEILTSGGGRVITGTVERVDPMRTILRSDAELPITMPNKVGTASDT